MASWASKILKNTILHIAMLIGFFWLYHKFAVYVMTNLNIKLGAIGKDIPPLYAEMRTDISQWLIPAIVIICVYIIVFRLFFENTNIPAYLLLPFVIVFTILIDVSVAMIDGGFEALQEPYTRTGLEYYNDVPKVQNIRYFLREYVSIFNTLTGHARTHPPGGIIFIYIVSCIFGYGLTQAVSSTIVFTSFTAIPVYFLTRQLYDEKTARYALGLFIITPNMVMFTATAMDGPFSVFPIFSVFFFYRSIFRRMIPYSVLTGLCLALGMFMNYTTVVIGILFIVTAIIYLFTDKNKFKAVVISLLIALLTFVAFYLFLYFWADYNVFDAFFAAYRKDEAVMGTGYENLGRYFHLSIANLFAFLIGVGIPLTAIWLREIVSEFRRIIQTRKTDVYIFSCFITLITISFSTLFTLEVERIWIFIAPFIVIPAAKHLCKNHNAWIFYIVLFLTCVQLVLSEVLLYTYW